MSCGLRVRRYSGRSFVRLARSSTRACRALQGLGAHRDLHVSQTRLLIATSIPPLGLWSFKGQPRLPSAEGWAPFAPYVTHLALSPLFAVSFHEPICSNFEDALPMFGWSTKDLQDATQIQNSTPTNNPTGQLNRCSQLASCHWTGS